jgi:hypothetical protein
VPVEEVTELLRRWREAGGVWSRGRVLTDGARLVTRLGPEERRVLAQALADHGAPDLARHLEGRTGHAIDSQQVQAFTDGLLDLDRARLDELIGALDDPAERHRLAQAALAQAGQELDAAAPPPPPGHQPPLAEPPPVAVPPDVPVDEMVADGHLDVQEIAAARLADQELGEIQLGGQELGEADLGGQDLGEATLGDVALVGQDLHEATLGEPDLDAGRPPVHDDEPPHADGPLGAVDGMAAVPPTAGDEIASVLLGAAADQEGSDAADRLVAELHACHTAAARSAVLTAGDLGALATAEALRVLDAVPTGWQRRRAARRLLDAGALTEVAPADLLERFPTTSDRTFVAGDLLAASELGPNDLTGLVPDAVVARFAARRRR